jgi:hypothetical protein
MLEFGEKIHDLIKKGYVNNHYEGCAPRTIEKINKLF